MKQWSIGAGPAATLLVSGDPDNPIPVLIQNVDPTNTAYLGETNSVNATNPRENVPLLPGQSSIATGDIDVYAIAAPGQNVALNTMRGFGSFFQPTNLTSLGGVAIYNTVSAPTQPPTIPLNSLWFTPTGGIMSWNGSAWVSEDFDAQQIIIANSITVNELAAGIVYAGIVNGTVIQGAIIRVVNGFGAVIMTINKSAGTWIQYLDTGSVTQGIPSASSAIAPFTDEFNNHLLGGTVTYELISGTIYAVQNYQGNINFVSAPNWTGTWNIYTSIEPDVASGSIAFFDNAGFRWVLGNKAVVNNAVPVTVSLLTFGSILHVGPLMTSGQGYHVRGWALYIGNQATGAPVFSWGGSGGLVLGAGSQNGFQRFSGGGVAPIIHNNTGALGAVTGPVFASNATNWLYEFDVYFIATTGGTLEVMAAMNSAGNPFQILQAYATIEHY